jgi:5-carboxymethyl-2-hydroxymuconate isomerase
MESQMPHLTIEYSANLSARADLDALCRTLHQAMLDTGLFELGAIRVRALECAHYAVADLLPENAFAALYLRIGAGRSAEDKTRAGAIIFEAATQALAALFATPHFALTLEIIEIDAALSWKKNAIHPRLRTKGGTHV